MKKQNICNDLGLLLVGLTFFTFSLPLSIGAEPIFLEKFSFLWIIFYLPFVLIYLDKHPRWVFLKAWGFFSLGSMTTLYWIVISMKNYGHLSISVSVLGLALTAVTRSFFPALALYVWNRFKTKETGLALGIVLMTLQDYLLHYIPFGGFPWLSPAYSLAPATYMIQVADLWGTHGLNAMVYFLSFSLFYAWINPAKSLHTCYKMLFPAVLILVFSIGYGFFRYHQIENDQSYDTINIGWVQGNISQDLKWDGGFQNEILNKYQNLSLAFQQTKPDLVIWPEAALPMNIQRDTPHLRRIKTKTFNIPLLVGAASYRHQADQTLYYNSAFLLDGSSKVIDVYDKMHLVPFGEFIPDLGLNLTKYFPTLAGSFQVGDSLKPMQILTHRFGISICYEVLYPSMFRKQANQGALFFINLTNDAWFDLSSGPYQHARFAIFRAIESRKSIVRVANTGISALYMPSGKVTQQTKLFQQDVRNVSVPKNPTKTFYAHFPFSAELLMLVLMAYCVLQWKKPS